MLYLIGLGLSDEKDITLRGLEAIKKCSKVYLERYTSILMCDTSKLEEVYGKPVEVATREDVEEGIDKVLEDAKDADIAMCIVGDPFGATTHSDLMQRASDTGVKVKVIHNASVMNAIGALGLQLYRYGEAVSICFFTDTWRPDSWYDKIKKNRQIGLHTLVLMDIRVKERDWSAMGKLKYEPPRYMSVNTCVEQLLEVEANKQEGVYSKDMLCVGVSRLGSDDQQIISGTLEELLTADFGPPLHSMVIPGELHPCEEAYLNLFRVNSSTPQIQPKADSDEDSD